mmetsp:Transcript_5811/g.18304  ORF Transcript_5811/g.18304 Transcript_5811/m.18304 type:complete len:96 (-) Transcript_5811:1237-1524(-)
MTAKDGAVPQGRVSEADKVREGHHSERPSRTNGHGAGNGEGGDVPRRERSRARIKMPPQRSGAGEHRTEHAMGHSSGFVLDAGVNVPRFHTAADR